LVAIGVLFRKYTEAQPKGLLPLSTEAPVCGYDGCSPTKAPIRSVT
jgi:hypothetical protein